MKIFEKVVLRRFEPKRDEVVGNWKRLHKGSLIICTPHQICTALLVGRSRDRFPVVSLGIFSVAPPDGTMCPGVDPDPENDYQGFLLG